MSGASQQTDHRPLSNKLPLGVVKRGNIGSPVPFEADRNLLGARDAGNEKWNAPEMNHPRGGFL